MDLRPYQQRALDAVTSAFADGARSLCVVAPTGAGKTVIGAAIADAISVPTVWVSHTRELDAQARARLPEFVSVITAQTLLARSHSPWGELLILDECHHYVAREWSTILDRYSAARVVGLTATPQRGDGVGLGNVFDRLIVAATYSELLASGHVVNCRVFSSPKGEGVADPVEQYQRHTPGERAFVYVSRVAEAHEVAARFSAAGVPAGVVSGRCAKASRDDTVQRFAAGDLQALVNVNTLTEGVDVPAASACVLARSVTHVGTYLQIAGRVLRPYPGKLRATMLDLAGCFRRFGPPTDDREYSLAGKGIGRAGSVTAVACCQQCGYAYRSGPPACPECGVTAPQPRRTYIHDTLREVYAGTATPNSAKMSEFERLRRVAYERSLPASWVVRQYEQLFDEPAPAYRFTPAEKASEFSRLLAQASKAGFRRGWAAHRYRAAFGEWPTWQR